MKRDTQTAAKIDDISVIGKSRKINIIGHVSGVPAKIDTGADSSAIWASDIHIDEEGKLHFKLFGPGSRHYTGEDIVRTDYKVAQIRSTTGHLQIRYRTHLSIRLGGKKIRSLFNLSDRAKSQYPILIGRRTITGKFHVDVSRGGRIKKVFNNKTLNVELQKNPYEFYKKYHDNATKEAE